MSLADKVKSGIYKLVYLIAKTILVALSLSLTLPLLFAEKTQDFVHLQLINAISSDLRKLRKYFKGTAIAAFFRILFPWFGASWATVLLIYLTDLTWLVLAISALKLVASSFQDNLNYIPLSGTLAWLNLNIHHRLLVFHQFCDTFSKRYIVLKCYLCCRSCSYRILPITNM